MTPTLRLPTLTLALLLAGCTLGPDYQRPTTTVPVAYRHAEGWQAAAPKDLEIRGDWWRRYDDPTLDRLMVQLNQRNQSLAQAEATYRQSLALVSQARASLFPTLLLCGNLDFGLSSPSVTSVKIFGVPPSNLRSFATAPVAINPAVAAAISAYENFDPIIPSRTPTACADHAARERVRKGAMRALRMA